MQHAYCHKWEQVQGVLSLFFQLTCAVLRRIIRQQSFLGLFRFDDRLEAAKEDDYRIRCEELEKELSELRQQNDELTALADDAPSLKDEIDVLG